MSKISFFLACVLLGSFIYAYSWQHLVREELRVPLSGYELTIAPGSSLRKVASELHTHEILRHPRLLCWYAIMRGYADKIQAGEYMLAHGTKPIELLDIVRDGSVTQHSVSIIEGQRVQDIVSMLQAHPKIEATLQGLSEQEIINKLNIPVAHLEGIFWPETYFITAKTKDVDFLRRAHLNMQSKLQDMWAKRDPNIKLHTAYEALILASIIEKESGDYAELAEISGVYHRRLQMGMKLQADPTVIYALGDTLQGPLLKSHLGVESAYNTYLHQGLPPTPIAIPSQKAIEAALHPAPGETLYFVATGEGTHVFSKTLEEHNQAVHKYRGC